MGTAAYIIGNTLINLSLFVVLIICYFLGSLIEEKENNLLETTDFF